MRTIEVDIITRMKLLGVIGSANGDDGGLTKLHALLPVYQQLVFTPEERREIKTTVLGPPGGDVKYEWDVQRLGERWGGCWVTLEDAQTEWVIRSIKDWSRRATIQDLEWIDPLIRELESSAPPLTHESTRSKRSSNK